MIGTTLKLGFDGTSVARGLSKVGGLFGRFSRQVGIGVARQMGAQVTDLMGRIITAAPMAMKETADWAGNMTDMSAQTGVSVEKLVLMEEALRLAGASARDTSMMISRLNDSLYEARTEGGAAKEALNKLGFMATDFRDVKVDKAFEMIGQRVAELGPEFKGTESIMSDLFGARMGFKLIRFFRDFDGGMKQAENNVGKLASAMNRQAPDLDQWSDALGRIENFKRSLSSIVLDEIFRITGGAGGVDRIFNFLDPEKVRPQIQQLVNMIGRNMEVLFSQDLTTSLGDFMTNLGRKFGEGIRESISPKAFLPPLFGFGKDKSTSMADPIGELKRHTSILSDIRREVGVAKFA